MNTIHPGLGINVVMKHNDKQSLSRYIDSLRELGVEWIRLEFNFYQPSDPELMDFLVSETHKNGIKILGLLTGLVPGTLVNCIYPKLKFKNPLDDLDNYHSFVEYNVIRYKSQIQYWEIWNEANTLRFWVRIPNPSDYVKLVSSIAPKIKKISPNSSIVLGGLMSDDLHSYAPFQKIHFLRNCLDQGIDDFIDIYNFHPYIPSCYYSGKKYEFYASEIKKAIDGYLNFYSEIKKPHWISEFGVCPLWVKLSLSEIGKLYKEIYEYSRQRNMNFFLWTLTDFKDPEYSKWNPETAFGMLDFELNPKESYLTFQRTFG